MPVSSSIGWNKFRSQKLCLLTPFIRYLFYGFFSIQIFILRIQEKKLKMDIATIDDCNL